MINVAECRLPRMAKATVFGCNALRKIVQDVVIDSKSVNACKRKNSEFTFPDFACWARRNAEKYFLDPSPQNHGILGSFCGVLRLR